MKAPKFFYAALLGAAVAIPVVSFAVTLPSASKTPCLFGALGNRSVCQVTSGGTARTNPQAPDAVPLSVPDTEIARFIRRATSYDVLPRTAIPPSAVIAKTSDDAKEGTIQAPEQLEAVPLPVGGALLLASLGAMLLTVRRKSS